MISAGLDQSDDEALYADVSRKRQLLYTEYHVSLWRRILTVLGKCCWLSFWYFYYSHTMSLADEYS